MRPLRGLIACLGTLLLLTVIVVLRRRDSEYDGPAATEETRRSRLRALFSFRTPESFFPPSAIISLTDDNSTFFVARPAAYGPSLPSDGLSGQLWIGSGFGEDSSSQGRLTMNAEGELGCSDIPGWPYTGLQESGNTDGKGKSSTSPGSKQQADQAKANVPVKTNAARSKGKRTSKASEEPQANDGTDNHLHWPLKGLSLIKGAKIPEKQDDLGKDTKDKEHADIQSLQESAEIAGKVVLLSRGGCGFLEKTKWVQRRGGKALIVGNNIRDPNLVNMYASEDTSNVTIPSIFTSHMSAHLLSSLLPPGGFRLGAVAEESDANPIPVSKKGSKKPVKPDTKTTSPNAQSASSSSTGGSWFSRLANVLGIRSKGPAAPNHRYPNSGRISWVQSDNWDDEITPRQSKSKQAETKDESQKKKGSQAGKQDKSDFVIGVHDWRDKEYLEVQKEQKLGTNTKSSSSTTAAAADSKATGDAKGKGFPSGNVVPGSGRYSVPGSVPENVAEDQSEQGSNGWFGKIFSSEDETLSAEEGDQGNPNPALAQSEADVPQPIPPLVDTPMPREGLWVTITPTTISSSPFFDTLLVLVVSPLVTLTVVYALLLLRARIQRRRWRAPKSVVERLPVRVYHTISSSSTSTSTHTPSVDASSATSPLLQPEHASTLTRTRPRSHTTTSINETAALTLERQRGDLASRYEKKKYSGKQVECVVCLEEYVDGQSQVMSLPCGHEFHADCITPWLTTRRRTCPICKGDVVRSLAGSSEPGLLDMDASPSRRNGALSPDSASRSRSESRDSRTRLLPDHDLERNRSNTRSPIRFNWQSLSTWWTGRPTREAGQSIDRDR